MLKVDLAKAFDRIEWCFIVSAMKRQGFKDRFIDLVHTCISTTTMAVIINGEPGPTFLPKRGIRQGCPLSPYLFILAVNELAICLQKNSASNNIQGIMLGPSCPRIHALLFADDLIICGQANADEACKINAILNKFCSASGQTPNLNKSSIIFSKNVDTQSKKEVKNFFPVSDLQPNAIYLGHPLIFNHADRSKAYSFIINKFRGKLSKLKANKLNHAGRLTYINSVLASIPIYYMTTILFSKKFIEKITSIMRKFWWSSIQDENDSVGFSFRSWKDICRPKNEGGLGIRDLFTVNKSLLLNAAWKIATGKNQFLSDILKAKYYPNSSFWLAGNHSTKSAFWASITSIKNTLVNNCVIQVHKGNSSIWSTPWCDIWNEIYNHLNLPVTINNLPSRIADLWDSHNLSWNNDIINLIFDRQAAISINKVKHVPSNENDRIIWKPANNGYCSAKNAFRYLNNLSRFQLPHQGPRSITNEAMGILKRVWNYKNISPVIKTFIWRLIRRAIATGERVSAFTDKIDKTCALCGFTENDMHMFFHCEFARAVWFSAKTPLLSSVLPQEQDGVQQCLTQIISPQVSDEILTQITTYLRFIWKVRNDLRFRKHSWSVLQVHLAVHAHIHSFSKVLLKEQTQNLMEMISAENNQVQVQARHLPSVPHSNFQHMQNNKTLCRFPETLSDARCFTDASTDPDVTYSSPRRAGLGIFFLDPRANNSYYIKLQINNITSVVMAEAAALAFAAAIASALGLKDITFLTDSQMLANYFNGQNLSCPPFWDAKPFT